MSENEDAQEDLKVHLVVIISLTLLLVIWLIIGEMLVHKMCDISALMCGYFMHIFGCKICKNISRKNQKPAQDSMTSTDLCWSPF